MEAPWANGTAEPSGISTITDRSASLRNPISTSTSTKPFTSPTPAGERQTISLDQRTHCPKPEEPGKTGAGEQIKSQISNLNFQIWDLSCELKRDILYCQWCRRPFRLRHPRQEWLHRWSWKQPWSGSSDHQRIWELNKHAQSLYQVHAALWWIPHQPRNRKTHSWL